MRNAANGAEVEAVVGGLGYVAQDVPLEVGLNRLEVTALDQHGNARSRSVELVRTLAGSGRLVALSGNRQAGPARALLPSSALRTPDSGCRRPMERGKSMPCACSAALLAKCV